MASRALDPQFNSVIVGNSTSIPLKPKDLDELTGQRFVSLSISGSDAPAAISSMEFFLSQHPAPRIVVVTLLSETWCSATFNEHRPFPFWLYSNLPHYFWGLAGDTSFELIKTTLKDRAKLRSHDFHPYIGIDGYHKLTGLFEQPSYNDPALVRARIDSFSRPVKTTNPDNAFPAIGHLLNAISRPSPAFYALLWTPRYITYIPAPGSEAEVSDLACKTKLRDLTAHIPNVVIVDWSGPDRLENSDPSNFYDIIHYRRRYARRIEESIRDALPVALKVP